MISVEAEYRVLRRRHLANSLHRRSYAERPQAKPRPTVRDGDMNAAFRLHAGKPISESSEKRFLGLASGRPETPIKLSGAIERSGTGCRDFVRCQTTPVPNIDLGNSPVEQYFRTFYLSIYDLCSLSSASERARMQLKSSTVQYCPQPFSHRQCLRLSPIRQARVVVPLINFPLIEFGFSVANEINHCFLNCGVSLMLPCAAETAS